MIAKGTIRYVTRV